MYEKYNKYMTINNSLNKTIDNVCDASMRKTAFHDSLVTGGEGIEKQLF